MNTCDAFIILAFRVSSFSCELQWKSGLMKKRELNKVTNKIKNSKDFANTFHNKVWQKHGFVKLSLSPGGIKLEFSAFFIAIFFFFLLVQFNFLKTLLLAEVSIKWYFFLFTHFLAKNFHLGTFKWKHIRCHFTEFSFWSGICFARFFATVEMKITSNGFDLHMNEIALV